MDPIAAARALPLAHDLSAHGRLIFVDHRGHGLSDHPTDPGLYALPVRVADILAVLDELQIDMAHYVGVSWGARLGFALAEYAPERVQSLVLSANQPYAWDEAWPIVQGVSAGIAATREGGMEAMLRWFESYAGRELVEPERSWLLDNDPNALRAAWQSALDEGPVSRDLSSWRTPCLVIAGERDDMFTNARRAAEEIPGARFVSIAGSGHLASVYESAVLLPEILRLWEEAGR